jgi:hypothetical protein
MTAREFQDWAAFYAAYPFDDMHRYHRPAALVARSMSGGDMQELLDWLQPPPCYAGMQQSDINTMRALGVRK